MAKSLSFFHVGEQDNLAAEAPVGFPKRSQEDGSQPLVEEKVLPVGNQGLISRLRPPDTSLGRYVSSLHLPPHRRDGSQVAWTRLVNNKVKENS